MELNLKAEDNLTPVWNQIIDMIEPGSTAIELGSGYGELLCKLSRKISSGVGIDKSQKRIKYARIRKNRLGISNIQFRCETLEKHHHEHLQMSDVSIACLFFHVIPVSDSVYLLNKMKDISHSIIISAFSRPESFQQKIALLLDQRFSDHYKNFRDYQKVGYMERILEKSECSGYTTSTVPFIKIYKI